MKKTTLNHIVKSCDFYDEKIIGEIYKDLRRIVYNAKGMEMDNDKMKFGYREGATQLDHDIDRTIESIVMMIKIRFDEYLETINKQEEIIKKLL